MPRDIPKALQDKLAAKKVFVADLLEFHFGTTLYFTTANIDLSYDSATAPDSGANSYIAQGLFLNYKDIVENSDLRVGTLDLSFTAVDPTMVAVLINNDFIDKRVVLYRAVLNDDYSFTSNDVFTIFDGRVSGWKLTEGTNSANVVLSVASFFADFNRTNGRRTNPASQNLHFSSDKGMDFSPQIVKDIKWGRP
jgi:hypothetical protein